MALKKPRTPAQRAADAFDAALYSLIGDARRHAHNLRDNRDQQTAWDHVGRELTNVRPRVREMMHRDDLAITD
jgi:hypothetical protein